MSYEIPEDADFKDVKFIALKVDSYVTLELTVRETQIFEWAIDPMGDYWMSEDGAWGRGDTRMYADDVAVIKDGVPTLAAIDDIIDDILYRIEDQYVEICRGEISDTQGIIPYYANQTAQWNREHVAKIEKQHEEIRKRQRTEIKNARQLAKKIRAATANCLVNSKG